MQLQQVSQGEKLVSMDVLELLLCHVWQGEEVKTKILHGCECIRQCHTQRLCSVSSRWTLYPTASLFISVVSFSLSWILLLSYLLSLSVCQSSNRGRDTLRSN